MRNMALFGLALLIGLVNPSFHAQEAKSNQQKRPAAETKSLAVPLKTTICDVVAAPDLIDGLMIEVRGKVFAGLETNILYDSNCKGRNGLPARILFTTDKSSLQPQEDGEYCKFWKVVRAYKSQKGKRNAMVPDK